MAQGQKSRDDEEMRVAQGLRLIKAFAALDNQPLREALIILAESLAAGANRRK